MEKSLEFLYAAIRAAEDNVRGYDLKAQIVGIGYIFTIGVISKIVTLSAEQPPFVPMTIILSWLIGIVPIVLFGSILYPSRKTAPSIGENRNDFKKLFFANSTCHGDLEVFISEMKTVNIQKELVYELLKLTALRDLKRTRFLRALWASALTFILIFVSQLYRSMG